MSTKNTRLGRRLAAALLAVAVTLMPLQSYAQAEGEVETEAATSAGTTKTSQTFPSAPRPRVVTSRYALIDFEAGTFGAGIANDGTTLIKTYTDNRRWRAGVSEVLQTPTNEAFDVRGINRSGYIVGDSHPPVQAGFSCLATSRGWYWAPGNSTAVEVNNQFTYRALDECGGGYWNVKGFRPLLVDSSNRVWAKAVYAANPANGTAFAGLLRWDTPGSNPTQVGYASPQAAGPYIELSDVNASGVMIGRRQVLNASRQEYFVGDQAVDFEPIDINDAGVVLGYDLTYSGSVLRRSDSTGTLPLFIGTMLNERGDIIGDTLEGPVLLPAEAVPDLLDVTVPDYTPYLIRNQMPAGWEVAEVNGINDSGAVVGTGLYSDPARPDSPAEIRAFVLVPAALRVDANRDGVIAASPLPANPDLELAQKELPWFFWLNDDNDSGETDGDDIPGKANGNAANTIVDGVRDLVDFFPVQIDIAALLRIFPSDDPSIVYRLAQADGAANFLITDLTADTAGNYQRDATVANTLASQPVTAITANGVTLSQAFLGKLRAEGKGIILVEARLATGKPLRLEVWRSNTRLTEVSLPLSFGGVEDMFRHVNLAGAVGMKPETVTRGGTPNWSKELESKRAFVFVHGYNVNQQQARGWEAEFFKRLWWGGSRAQFWGVTWWGAESQVPVANFSPDFQSNVVNAFGTAPQFKEFLAELSTHEHIPDINVAAHSLGNVVVSAAISDYAAPVTRYFLIDAAVAAEAYDPAEAQPDDATATMPHTEWTRERGGVYPSRLWASNWYQLFPEGDTRHKLTWRGRFAPKPDTAYYDFHSTGEEVLGRDTDSTPGVPRILAREFFHFILPAQKSQPPGTNAWVYQEKLKGRTITGKILGSKLGGWGFNNFVLRKTPEPKGAGPRLSPVDLSPPEATALSDLLTNQDLQAEPFFRPGSSRIKVGTWLLQPAGDRKFIQEKLGALYGTGGSAFALRHRDTLLARMIPAMSLAAGFQSVGKFTPDGTKSHSFDMNEVGIRQKDRPWPATRGVDADWHHSDLREVPYPYVRGLYDQLVALGLLQQQTP